MHFGEGVDATGTANEDLSVILGVEVDEPFGTEHAVLQFHGAGESGLLIDGEETLDSRVREFGIGDGGERHGDTYTVIAAKGSTFGFEPFAVHVGLNGVGHEIMLNVAVFLAHHVHVRLEDDSFMVFVTRGSRHPHDDIHRLICDILDMMGCSKIAQPFTDFLLVLGGTRYFVDLRKDLKNCFRLHIEFRFIFKFGYKVTTFFAYIKKKVYLCSVKYESTMQKSFFFLLLLAVLSSCNHRPLHVMDATTEAIPVNETADAIQDSSYLAYLAPIKEDMEREMNVQLGYAPEALCVGGPECPMVNWASDALWEAAKKVYDGRVDIAIVNMGGIRCPWSAGPITKGNVFELMPFDNRLVVLTLKGEEVLALCESFAKYGGQGVAGMRVKIVNGQVADVQIGGKALDTKALYTVATSDYLSGGADHMDALARYVDYWNSDLLIRDLYLEAVREQDTIRAAVDGRMTIYP